MGIPSYFGHLIRNYKDIVFRLQDSKYNFDSVNRLFFDLNCAIHPCAKKVADNNEYNPILQNRYEQKIINETIQYIRDIINVAQPDTLVYIAIDGVAPRAKMEQQRTRRFKSIKEKATIRDIKSQYDEDYKNTPQWDTNAITPGTVFMEKLADKLREFITYDKIFKNLKVILSDSNCPGEGEHKIMNYIKKEDTKFIDVVYGLDADLIMLSMIRTGSIYLLRERIHFGKNIDINDVEFVYLDIKKLERYLIQEFEMLIEGPFDNYQFRRALLDDYIFICFLLGNDFIPHSPALSIRNKGVELLLEIYAESYKRYGQNLVNRNTLRINHKMLSNIIRELYHREDDLLKKKWGKLKRYRIRFDKCKTLLDRKLEEHSRYPMLHRQQEQRLNMGEKGWVQRYYGDMFQMERPQYKTVCHNFIEALVWTFKYYYGDCASWSWYYRYRHAPPFEDICSYLEDELVDINEIRMTQAKPYTPFRQLTTVLPPASANLLPTSYRDIVRGKDIRVASYFPVDFTNVDTLFNTFYWQCIPVLPIIDNALIYKIIKKCSLTKNEKIRNKLGCEFINF